MPRGGKRPNAGRRKLKAERPEANKAVATQVLALVAKPIHIKDCSCDLCAWWELLTASDQRLRFDVRKYLTDRRDGKAVQTVNHLHDKPMEVNVNVSMAEIVRKVRLRKEEYERARK